MFKYLSKLLLQTLMMGFLFSAFFSAQASAKESCSIPQNLNTWDYYSKEHIRRGKDWKSDEDTDYWKLVYSWSPYFCKSQGNRATKLEQCKQGFGLIVHGLWAQKAGTTNIRLHPRNCVDAPAVPKQVLKENFCIMPDVKLMQKEWEKHGTCDFDRAEDYFSAIQTLHEKIKMPDTQTVKSLQNKSAQVLRRWIVDNNQGQGVELEHVEVIKRGNRLKEISVCFEKDFSLRSCRSNKKGIYQKKENSKKYSDDKNNKPYDRNDEKSDIQELRNKYVNNKKDQSAEIDEKKESQVESHDDLSWWKKCLLVIVKILNGIINS